MSRRVASRARLHDDRAGDPLDGLVNLFDVGVVLAVAFLLAALSSLELSPNALKENRDASRPTAPQDAVIAEPGETSGPIELQPGERVVGRGERLGEVYRLRDGRTVLVRPGASPSPAPSP